MRKVMNTVEVMVNDVIYLNTNYEVFSQGEFIRYCVSYFDEGKIMIQYFRDIEKAEKMVENLKFLIQIDVDVDDIDLSLIFEEEGDIVSKTLTNFKMA